MSLINDALKRAKHHQAPAIPADITPVAGVPMRPAETIRRPPSSASPMIVGLIVIVLLLAGMLFYLAGRSSSGSSNASSTPTTASQGTSVKSANSGGLLPADSGLKPGGVTSETNRSEANAKPLEPIVAVAPPSPAIITQVVVINPTPAPATPPAPLKLQALFYLPSRPSAMINGKTVYIGDRVGDARVLAITQTSVSLLQAGQTNVLSLE